MAVVWIARLLVACGTLKFASAFSSPVVAGDIGLLSLRGAAGSARHNLVRGGDAAGESGKFPKDETFFNKDAEKMDELPPYQSAPKKRCHPKCVWDCGGDVCQNTCQPFCEAPRCETRCKEVDMSKCRRQCSDPMCSIICPPQCEHGQCPECQTVCNKVDCPLDCGHAMCENVCADPVCTWKCQPDPKCEPHCKLRCEDKICDLDHVDDGPPVPDEHISAQLGWEVAWKGFAKVPQDHLQALKAEPPVGPAGMTGGALPPIVATIDPGPNASATFANDTQILPILPADMQGALVAQRGAQMPTGALPAPVAGLASGPQPLS